MAGEPPDGDETDPDVIPNQYGKLYIHKVAVQGPTRNFWRGLRALDKWHQANLSSRGFLGIIIIARVHVRTIQWMVRDYPIHMQSVLVVAVALVGDPEVVFVRH